MFNRHNIVVLLQPNLLVKMPLHKKPSSLNIQPPTGE